ncbi:HAD family hydrolase [Cylindrospermopsis raciborskii S07]|uniref:HAD family hydrolase n=2 Tax=Cylindrospermopsis raciborskii TaxID=77022 RepID=A0A838WLF8_9CYAN|nr:HAD family hydrolase [Cylindrospermopsis raciborskii]MBA4446276.1 HAD family hydrolase [Cylindrospermopsis raciborskii CS-506_C]MBA4450516.1 HAD family hydrolase [Cylindrospermopsis raciborskii CS-506_D]MBA4457123.1 HAD family hydrolase [Cylindrospermopsis raciborskii CS-506_B]MBA4466491.1 HAD family hydrolase [Cylindrospermopsis raciborskii CS-506_A]OHY35891.1 haloacid dehalogenase [Cylindrospermopsis raciborskii CS-508]
MLRLITDFDGPIMDVSERYYRVYLLCLQKTKYPSQVIHKLTKEEFWQFKRSHTAEKQIAFKSGLDAEQAQEFAKIRKETVHTEPYFDYDIMVPGALEALVKVKEAGIDLVVMTMRRVRELNYAFDKFNLDKFFPEDRRYCLSNDYIKTRDIEDKPLLMAKAIKELPPATEIWMVGDTEADITAAKKHAVKMIGVESGIRDRTQLELYQPDFILEDLKAAVNFINQF